MLKICLLTTVLTMLIIYVSGNPQDVEDVKHTYTELMNSLNKVEDQIPCTLGGDPGICIPYYLCTDVTSIKGDGSCDLLNVCCKKDFIYTPSTEKIDQETPLPPSSESNIDEDSEKSEDPASEGDI